MPNIIAMVSATWLPRVKSMRLVRIGLSFRHTLDVLGDDLFDVLWFAILEELPHATDEELEHPSITRRPCLTG